MSDDIAIAAVHEVPPGRYRELDEFGMYRHVIAESLRAWGLRPDDVDGLFAAPAGLAAAGRIDVFVHERLSAEFGLSPRVAECVNAGGATYAIMAQRAAALIRDGQADAILCVGAGKFPQVRGRSSRPQTAHPTFEHPYGPTIVGMYALAASQYLHEYGCARTDLAAVAVAARNWALRNPRAIAHDRGPLSTDDVLMSRPIATPFHLYDCSIPCEGGGAFLVTTPTRAYQLSQQPALLLGYGESHTGGLISQRRSLVQSGAAASAADAFRRSGLGAGDIDVAEIYDAFTINPLLTLENAGFFEPGRAGRFFRDGGADPGGSLPVNTNGGLLSYGHTGDASGLSVIAEGVRQVTGSAGPNQVEGARTAFVHCYGGMMADHATLILGAA